jgi:hypothetical protein
MGGGINPGVYVYPGATVRGAVERGIPGPDWGPGATRAGKFTVVASTAGRYKAAPITALIAMDKLLFWLGLGAAQKGAGSKPIERRNWRPDLGKRWPSRLVATAADEA